MSPTMSNQACVIGIDYGTLSARAVLVNSITGHVICRHTVPYAHGVTEDGLADIRDYESALTELLEAVTPREYRDHIVGLCVDATSLTLVCTTKDGTPLATRFPDREQAQIKLWKRHAAQPQADEALALAVKLNEPFLKRTGGTISCEWTLPKVLEIRDRDPEVYAAVDLAFDLCEYLTFLLTGTLTRSTGAMSFKSLWAEDLGFPSEAFLDGLRPGFAAEYRHILRGPVRRPGDCAGTLRPEFCRRFGLRQDVVVASGMLDGHTSPLALGALYAGDATLVVGTSNVLTIQMDRLREVEGICGVAQHGLTAGLCGIDSGQACTGDMLAWYMRQALPEHVFTEAKRRGISPHTLLAEPIRQPWNNSVIAADWWNGSRNAPCDLTLRGVFAGMSLETKPCDLYLALLQSIVCGTREIIGQCAAHGVTIRRLFATGGITEKNPLLMQEYAEILNLPVHVGQVTEGPALGAAMLASVAAGIHPDAAAAWQHMGVHQYTTYEPTPGLRDAYETLYQKNHRLRQLIRQF